MRRTRWRRGSPAPTTAKQPDLLMSTVTPLACCRWEPSSHSTWNFTRETIRRWVRNFSHRSSNALPSGMLTVVATVSVAMSASQSVGFVLGRGTAKDKLLRTIAPVNSTHSSFFACTSTENGPPRNRRLPRNLLHVKVLARSRRLSLGFPSPFLLYIICATAEDSSGLRKYLRARKCVQKSGSPIEERDSLCPASSPHASGNVEVTPCPRKKIPPVVPVDLFCRSPQPPQRWLSDIASSPSRCLQMLPRFPIRVLIRKMQCSSMRTRTRWVPAAWLAARSMTSLPKAAATR